jgi:hypothetical protein
MKLELTKEQIENINNELSNKYYIWREQGIAIQPQGVPLHVTEPVLYNSYITHGVSGGNCWNNNKYRFDNGKDDRKEFITIRLVLSELRIHHSIIEQTYRDIDRLLIENDDYCDTHYYGNYDNYTVEYIPLSKLLNYLQGFRLENDTISFNKNKIDNILTDLSILKKSCVNILKIFNIETNVDFINLNLEPNFTSYNIYINILDDNGNVEADDIINITDEQGFLRVYDTSEQESHMIPIRFFSMNENEIKKELNLL